MAKKKKVTSRENPSALDHTVAYVKSFIKDRNVASVTPTSSHVVNQICDRMRFDRDLTVIEYGAGTGVFTFELLKRMTSGSRLLAFETNPDLAELLEKHNDPRLAVSTESAARVSEVRNDIGLPAAEYILSGIPFSFFDAGLRREIVLKTYDNIRPEGRFLVYQASWMMKDLIEEIFGNIDTDSYLLNIPPMFLMDAIRN